MAEILGVVASGIAVGSLAAQILGSVSQILDFCSSINDAPDDIRDLLKELEILAEFVTIIEACDSQGDRSATTFKALQYCQDASGSLAAVVNSIKLGFAVNNKTKRSWAAVRAVMKEKNLKKCLDRLERAKAMLFYAQQVHQTTLIQNVVRAHNIMGPPNGIPALHQTSPDGGAIAPEPNLKAIQVEHKSYWLLVGEVHVCSKGEEGFDENGEKRNLLKEVRYCFAPASWSFLQGFEVLSRKAWGRWQYTWQSHRTIHEENELFEACCKGNLGRIQEICSRGIATPFDRTAGGLTLLHVAAGYFYPTICSWLIRQGLDGTMTCNGEDNRGITPLMLATSWTLSSEERASWNATGPSPRVSKRFGVGKNVQSLTEEMDTIRTLVEEGDSDPMALTESDCVIGPSSAIHFYQGSVDGFRLMINSGYPYVRPWGRSEEDYSHFHLVMGFKIEL